MANPSQIPRTVDYTVAWISAIGKEYTIACALLDEEFTRPADIPNDDSCYTFGRIGHHNVVMACLPLAWVGTAQATRLATELLHTFPSLKLGLMVGIGGGAPNDRHDIRLGDVVVSTPDARKRCGGVMQYNFGRTVQGSGFEPTGFLNQPHQILLNAANKLKATHERKGHQINEIVADVITRNSPRLDEYKRPQHVDDILYKPSFIHENEQVHCHESCQILENQEVQRQERRYGYDPPTIHYGIIGSADNLMRDANLRDLVAQRDGVLCFDMESAGIMSSELRCLVVRGVSDYSDTHKNDDWQKHAAAMAAGYTKELLNTIGGQQVYEDDRLRNRRGLLSRRPDVLQLLAFENMNDKHDYCVPEVSFSHEWIWLTSFNAWLATPDKAYWICGKPGSGKSTLMAYLVHSRRMLDRLEEGGPSYNILHFFYDCRAGSTLANSIQGMLRMFLYQLADQFDQVHHRLQILVAEDRLKLDTVEDLLEVAREALNIPDSKICIFIDGLDEYEGDLFELMHTCRLLKDWTGIKLCIASRPEARVSAVFDLHDQILMQDYNEDSMWEYCTDQILKASSTKLDLTLNFTPVLLNELIDKAEGIILWFKLATDEIVGQYVVGTSTEDIRKIIVDIPQGLDAMYERILQRIPVEYKHEAAFLLFLIQQLRLLNEDIHDLSHRQELSTIIFSATDMDHVWGAYDFVAEQLGDDIQLQRLQSQKALQVRIKLLLAGLVEIYQVEKEKALTWGTTDLDVRYIHKTLYSFMQRTKWIDDHLHPMVRGRFPEPFWLVFLTNMIVEATEDEVVSRSEIEECKKDTLAVSSLVGCSGITESQAISRLGQTFVNRSSALVGVIQAFGTYAPGGRLSRMDKMVDTVQLWLLNSFRSDFRFDPKWASRHVLLRTAFLNLLDLAYKYEKDERSSFTSIYPAMKSYLNTIFAFHLLIQTDDAHQEMLVPLIQRPEFHAIWDLAVAIHNRLKGYFSDRMFEFLPATEEEREFLVTAVLVQSWDPRKRESVFPFLHTLAVHGCYLNCRQICFFFTRCPTSQLAAFHARGLKHILPPDLNSSEPRHCLCTHKSQPVGLLFHWASFSCFDSASVRSDEKSTSDHEELLEFLLELGIDINAQCYAGGTVLHAVLDDEVKPAYDRQQLRRKAKFMALIKHGINPRSFGEKGNALEAALSTKKRQSRWRFVPGLATDLSDINFIIEYLQFYEANDSWPTAFESDDERASDIDEKEDIVADVGDDESQYVYRNSTADGEVTSAEIDLVHVDPTPIFDRRAACQVEVDPEEIENPEESDTSTTNEPYVTETLIHDYGQDFSDDEEFFPAPSRSFTEEEQEGDKSQISRATKEVLSSTVAETQEMQLADMPPSVQPDPSIPQGELAICEEAGPISTTTTRPQEIALPQDRGVVPAMAENRPPLPPRPPRGLDLAQEHTPVPQTPEVQPVQAQDDHVSTTLTNTCSIPQIIEPESFSGNNAPIGTTLRDQADATDLTPSHPIEAQGSLSASRTAGLERLWDAQASHFSANVRLVPRAVWEDINHDQAHVWLFVFQTLQNLGLRTSRDVDDTITGVLQASNFRNVRQAIVILLDIFDRRDLLVQFYAIEKDQLEPILELEGIDVDEKQGMREKVRYDLDRSPQKTQIESGPSTPRSPPSSQSSNLTPPNSGQVQHTSNLGYITGGPSIPDTPPPPPPPPYWPSIPESSVATSTSTSPALPESLASPQLQARQVMHSYNFCEPGMLRHRMFQDPSRRQSLRTDPNVRTKTKITSLQFDRLLLEDFRWTIIEHLGYGHDAAPSRQASHQFLKDATWDFDLAIARCVEQLGGSEAAQTSFAETGFGGLRR